MNKVIEYFKNLVSYKIFSQNIKVYGWEFNYDYELVSSVLPYLFEKLEIIENIAPESNENRDGRIREKKYITIHDTGDTTSFRGAEYWSDVVREQCQKEMGTKYAASFQYVVGSDGIYHNIPDNEIAYHAGDTTKFDYALYDTKIKEQSMIKLEVKDSEYYINDIPTGVKVNSEHTDLKTSDLNSQGVLVKVVNGTYHIGETYFNETYKKIANRGGNNNSIGMEICINQGTDIYKTWQRAAKLTAYLLDQNNLEFKDIKQHHYFSGKDCPMTMRKNNLYDHFLFLVKVEYDILQFIKEGYTIEFESLCENVDSDGRVKDINSPTTSRVKVIYNNQVEYYDI